MSLWTSLGFTGNPYDARPLPANDEGAELLIGRDREVRTLLSQLSNQSLHPTLEGENGVGKTSLALVATYLALMQRKAGKREQTFIPVSQAMQLSGNAADFERGALFVVAQALIDNSELLKGLGHDVGGINHLKTWLNDPIISGIGGGIQILGLGANGEHSREANTTRGFEEAGFRALVRNALASVFPNEQSGALVVIIDNIELLSQSNQAKKALEDLRDGCLSWAGVKWILAGAKGIVRAAASSPRLDGRVAAPIEILPISDESMPDLIQARLKYFSHPGAAAYPPVDVDGFMHLYQICNHNLRTALKYAQDFSIWLEVEGLESEPRKFSPLLEEWLIGEAKKTVESLRLQPRQWGLFDDLVNRGGSCAPGDNKEFGFGTMQQMRTNFAALEKVDLVMSEIDEDDHRRKTVSLTPKGWIVSYSRSRKG